MARVRKLSRFISLALTCAMAPALAGADTVVDWRKWRCAPEPSWTPNIQTAAAPLVRAAAIDSQAVVGEDYFAWARRVFTADELVDPLVSGPDAEYLDDGVSNLTKYAFGYGPAKECPEALGESVELDGNWFFHFDWPSDVSDVEFRVEVSMDLVNWTTAGVTLEPILAVDGAESWQAQYQAAADGSVYFRLVTALR